MSARNILLLLPLIIIFGCTAAEESTEQQEKKSPEVYVFDDVSKVDSSKIVAPEKPISKPVPVVNDQPPVNTVKKYVIQLGAFTSKERADSFISENQAKTSLPMSISFNAQSKLFAVQLPFYNTKEEADSIRDNLRKFPAFKDAFITTVEK